MTMEHSAYEPRLRQSVLLLVALSTAAASSFATSNNDDDDEEGAGSCSQIAKNALAACKHEIEGDFWIAVGNCNNLPADTGYNAHIQKRR